MALEELKTAPFVQGMSDFLQAEIVLTFPLLGISNSNYYMMLVRHSNHIYWIITSYSSFIISMEYPPLTGLKDYLAF